MKIKGEVLAVETTGDQLRMRMQTSVESQGQYYPMGVSSVEVPANAKNGRTYYVGRVVRITMAPKP